MARGVIGSSGIGTPQKTSRRFVTRSSTNCGSREPSVGQRASESTRALSSVGSEVSMKASMRIAKVCEHEGAQ